MIAIDAGTHLIQPGLAAPPLVCVSVYCGDGEPGLFHRSYGALADTLRNMLRGPVVGANLVDDLGVMAAHDPSLTDDIFEALEKGRVYLLTSWRLSMPSRRGTYIKIRSLVDLSEGTLWQDWKNCISGAIATSKRKADGAPATPYSKIPPWRNGLLRPFSTRRTTRKEPGK